LKTFIVDTNVLLHDPTCLGSFQNNEVIIPISVLDELDTAKMRPDAIGRNARAVIRQLDNLRQAGSLSEGVRLRETTIKIELNHCDRIPNGLSLEKQDNRIISVALGLKSEGKSVIVITKDINLRVKCDALRLPAEDYETDKVVDDPLEAYDGIRTIEVPSTTIDELYNSDYGLSDFNGHANQFFLLKSTEKENHVGIGRLINGRLRAVRAPKDIHGIEPRNLEQKNGCRPAVGSRY